MICYFPKKSVFVSLAAAFLLAFYCPYQAKATTSFSSLEASGTVTGSDSLAVSVHNLSDDQQTTKVQFGNTTGIAKASQYLQIDYDSNALGARIIIRTDNRNSVVAYSGSGEGSGLVGNTHRDETVPLVWVVFDELASAKTFIFTGDTDIDGQKVGSLPGANPRLAAEAEGLVVDKANTNFETQNVLDYATIVLPSGTTGLLGSFPTDDDGAGPSTGLRSSTTPVFLILGADFVNARSQSYSTTTLSLDLIVQ